MARNFPARSEAEKLKRIRLEMSKLGVEALVLSDSHAVAGPSISAAPTFHTPLPLSYALVPKDGRPTVFIDHRKLSNLTRDHLEHSADVREPDALVPDLTELARSGAAIALDSVTAADALSRLIAGAGETGARQRSGEPVEGSEEHHRDRGHADRAPARRGGAGHASSPGSTARRRPAR